MGIRGAVVSLQMASACLRILMLYGKGIGYLKDTRGRIYEICSLHHIFWKVVFLDKVAPLHRSFLAELKYLLGFSHLVGVGPLTYSIGG